MPKTLIIDNYDADPLSHNIYSGFAVGSLGDGIHPERGREEKASGGIVKRTDNANQFGVNFICY